MSDSIEARRERARLRRESWTIEPLTDHAPASPVEMVERFRELERLRRLAAALSGVPYPEQRTSIDERRRWPVKRIAGSDDGT